MDNDDSIDSINELNKTSSNNVEVIIQLFDEHPNNLNLFLEDDYENLLSLNTAFYKSENDKTFNLFNLQDYSNYYKCENIPFLVYNYDNVEDFYKSDFNKLSKYSEHIKNVFIESPDYHDCANRNSSTFSTSYKFGDALTDIGIPTTKSFDGSGVKIGSIESGIPDNYVNLTHTYYETFGSSPSRHCFLTSSIYGGDNGIASGASIYFAALDDASFSECIDWLIGRGVNVINRSNSGASGTYNSQSALVDYVIQTRKITFINSAGNSGDINKIGHPSTGLNVICVGSNSSNKAIAYSSSAGLSSEYNFLYKPTLVAPGDKLYDIPTFIALSAVQVFPRQW